jgi:hypothetical protein
MPAQRRRILGFAGLLIGLIALIAAVLTAVNGPSSGTHSATKANGGGTTTPTRTPFAANSIWNAALPSRAPIASDSSTLIAELQRQVARYGTWINTDSYSTPIYTVSASQPRVPVVLDPPSTSASATRLSSTFRAGVPIPVGARPAPGTDADLVVWQPSTNTLWELWNAQRVGSTWHARWGGRMGNVSRNPGYFTDPPDWGTAATSLALLGGTIRLSDLQAGHIDHALAISIPQARKGVVAWPAQRTDGNLSSPVAIPEGTRFRLDPTLNLNALHLPPVTRMIAVAAQRYGLFVRDQSGAVVFYGEQPTQSGPNPYSGPNGVFGGLDPKRLTAAFPWSHLEVVSAPLHPYQ